MIEEKVAPMSAQEITELCLRHTLYDWSSQRGLQPLPVVSARGVRFQTADGRSFLDFNSQLMSVNAGHGDPRIIRAIQAQAEQLAYVSPFLASEPRARLGQKLAGLLPGDIDKVFFTLGGTDANENAIKMARAVTGRPKVLARYRSYHGSVGAAGAATGDPRRWANEVGITNVVHVTDPFHGTGRPADPADVALSHLEEVIQLEGPGTIAAFLLEPVAGTNGVLIPPDGYLQGVRELCDRHGILLITDEVMSGFGRTGRWFAVEHWGVVPDLITMAKGLTSSYVPLGAVGMRPHIASHFDDNVWFGGLTYNSHPLACAAGLGALEAYEEDGMVENAARLEPLVRAHMQELAERHPSVGEARVLGLFGCFDLVRDRAGRTPMSPFNTIGPEMRALSAELLARGLFAYARWSTVHVVPPLCINEDELAEGFAILDAALSITDAVVE